MALPKYKLSRASTRARKAQWKAGLKPPELTECPHCHRKIPNHRGCPHCGYYKGKVFKAVKTET
ncbi:MAG: 50S ribosomal protein L32 [bacterium]